MRERPCAANAAELLPVVLVEAGHPKVRRTIEGKVITYDILSPGSWVNWISLACITNVWGSRFYSIIIYAGGASWPWWLYNMVARFFVMVTFCIGIAFCWRPSVRLTPEWLRVREQSWLGWKTRELATGADVVVRQACHNSGEGDRVLILVSSQGQDIEFGSVFGKDIVVFLIMAIKDYYNSEAAPAPAPMDNLLSQAGIRLKLKHNRHTT